MVSLYSPAQVNMALSPSKYCIANGSENEKNPTLLWVSDCSLTPSELYVSYIMATTSYIRWDYNDVCFVLDQHA